MDIIKVRELKKTYTTYERSGSFIDSVKSLFIRKAIKVEALKGISFDVAEGEILGFLGPNGAGKSTTLKILTGVLYPSSGDAIVMGYTPWKQRRAYVDNIGAVFGQKSQLIWDIPAIDSFEMNRAIYSIPKKVYKDRLSTLVELLGAEDCIYKPTRQLSLGQRMKCEFIMAMLHDPKIVFLDEPTIGLDVIAKDRIREFIIEQNKKGTTFILTTHDLSDVERLAKRVIVVNRGEIVYDNTLDSLRRYFGNKKLVNISSHSPLPDFAPTKGITVKEAITPCDAVLELDSDVMDFNDLISYVNAHSQIADITVSSPPIESVIKKLYQKSD
ncbi:MAG TPA: ATP-binding cassette domain-containing protein [Clostridia bacterium]|nr:ATP-binding cassette domain-containing protein [Clostridia bacterium]